MKQGDKVKAYVWKQSRTGNMYTLQVDTKNGIRIVKRIHKVVDASNWELLGETVGGKKATLLYARRFKSEKELKNWAKEFPYDVYKIDQNGSGKERRFG